MLQGRRGFLANGRGLRRGKGGTRPRRDRGSGLVIPTVLLLDYFIAPGNGQPLASHTMDVGSGWTVFTGDLNCTSTGRVICSAVDANAANADTGSSGQVNATQILDMTWADGDTFAGLIGRKLDAGNYWEIIYNPATPAWELYEWVAASPTLRASSAVTLTNGQTYRLKVVWTSVQVLSFSVDGSGVFDYAGSHAFQAGRTLFGMQAFKESAIPATTFDYFEVTSP